MAFFGNPVEQRNREEPILFCRALNDPKLAKKTMEKKPTSLAEAKNIVDQELGLRAFARGLEPGRGTGQPSGGGQDPFKMATGTNTGINNRGLDLLNQTAQKAEEAQKWTQQQAVNNQLRQALQQLTTQNQQQQNLIGQLQNPSYNRQQMSGGGNNRRNNNNNNNNNSGGNQRNMGPSGNGNNQGPPWTQTANGTGGGQQNRGQGMGNASGGSRPPSFPRLTPEERERRMQAGECFICSSPDHPQRNCPDNPRSQRQGTHMIQQRSPTQMWANSNMNHGPDPNWGGRSNNGNKGTNRTWANWNIDQTTMGGNPETDGQTQDQGNAQGSFPTHGPQGNLQDLMGQAPTRRENNGGRTQTAPTLNAGYQNFLDQLQADGQQPTTSQQTLLQDQWSGRF